MARYVGFKIGKVHEEHIISEYYCGGCGYPVMDHDSFCPECGGAFRKSDADDDENAKLRELLGDALKTLSCKRFDGSIGCTESCPHWQFGKDCQLVDGCWLELEAAKLGVEVD